MLVNSTEEKFKIKIRKWINKRSLHKRKKRVEILWRWNTDNLKSLYVRCRQLNFTVFLKLNIWIYHLFLKNLHCLSRSWRMDHYIIETFPWLVVLLWVCEGTSSCRLTVLILSVSSEFTIIFILKNYFHSWSFNHCSE